MSAALFRASRSLPWYEQRDRGTGAGTEAYLDVGNVVYRVGNALHIVLKEIGKVELCERHATLQLQVRCFTGLRSEASESRNTTEKHVVIH